MYMAIFLIICVATLMHRIAERRRGWLWGSMTTIVMLLLYQMGLSSSIGGIVGFVLMFASMTIANIYKPIDKGPFQGTSEQPR